MAPPPPQTPHYTAESHIVEILRAAGHQAFFAGGCVRDILLNLEPQDFDVATSATPDIILSLFPNKKTLTVGAHFGVVLVCEPNDGEDEAISTEVATFRHDAAYSDGRGPEDV